MTPPCKVNMVRNLLYCIIIHTLSFLVTHPVLYSPILYSIRKFVKIQFFSVKQTFEFGFFPCGSDSNLRSDIGLGDLVEPWEGSGIKQESFTRSFPLFTASSFCLDKEFFFPLNQFFFRRYLVLSGFSSHSLSSSLFNVLSFRLDGQGGGRGGHGWSLRGQGGGRGLENLGLCRARSPTPGLWKSSSLFSPKKFAN